MRKSSGTEPQVNEKPQDEQQRLHRPARGGEPLSRRETLSLMAAAGAGLAGVALFAGGRNAFADEPLDCCATVTIAELRGMTTPQTNHLYFVSDYGKEGVFLYDPADSVSSDNLGTVVVSSSGARFKRVYESYVSAKWFGAIADGSSHPLSGFFSTLPAAQAIFPFATALTDEMDWIGIQAALLFASSSASYTRKVFMPSGTYVLNQRIEPQWDDLELYGIPNGTVLSLNANSSAIRVSVPSGSGYSEVRRLVFRDFTISAANGKGPYGSGIITLQKSIDTFIDNIRIVADSGALTTNNRLCSGLLLDEQSSGIVRNILVEGVTDAGIELSGGAHHVTLDGCETRGSSGPSGSSPGVRLAGCSNVIVSSLQSHDNQGAGLQITADSERQSGHIEVRACQFSDNGTHGVWLSSDSDGANPHQIHLTGIIADGNGYEGIRIEAGTKLTVEYPMCHSNGRSGIALEQKYTSGDNWNISQVKLSYPKSYNNGQTAVGAGIALKATERVTVRGGSCSDTQTTRTQAYGIKINSDLNGKVPQHLHLYDLVAHDNATEDFSLSTAPAASGHYRLQAEGTPENVLAAPTGSEYSDLTSGGGKKFIKQSGNGTTGWKEVVLAP